MPFSSRSISLFLSSGSVPATGITLEVCRPKKAVPSKSRRLRKFQFFLNVLTKRVFHKGACFELLVQRAALVHVQGGQEDQIGLDLVEQLCAGSGVLHGFFHAGRAEDDIGGKVYARAFSRLSWVRASSSVKPLLRWCSTSSRPDSMPMFSSLIFSSRSWRSSSSVFAHDVFHRGVHGDGLDLREHLVYLLRDGLELSALSTKGSAFTRKMRRTEP
jgi:hypothetical protein